MVICLERIADLHMAKRIPLPLTVSCSSKIQVAQNHYLVLSHLTSDFELPGINHKHNSKIKKIYGKPVRSVDIYISRFSLGSGPGRPGGAYIATPATE